MPNCPSIEHHPLDPTRTCFCHPVHPPPSGCGELTEPIGSHERCPQPFDPQVRLLSWFKKLKGRAFGGGRIVPVSAGTSLLSAATAQHATFEYLHPPPLSFPDLFLPSFVPFSFLFLSFIHVPFPFSLFSSLFLFSFLFFSFLFPILCLSSLPSLSPRSFFL